MLRFVGICAALAVLLVDGGGGSSAALARIQDGSADVCWSPDFEWPVPCDDDE